MNDLVELVAMTSTGDVLILRTKDGQCWLHSQFEGEKSVLQSEDEVDQAISMGSFRVIRETFSSYSDLGRFIDEQVAQVPTTGRSSEQVSSAYEAELLLASALRWKSKGTADGRQMAVDVITRLLQSPPALADPRLHDRLQQELDDLRLAPKRRQDAQLRVLKAEAFQRFSQAAA